MSTVLSFVLYRVYYTRMRIAIQLLSTAMPTEFLTFSFQTEKTESKVVKPKLFHVQSIYFPHSDNEMQQSSSC